MVSAKKSHGSGPPTGQFSRSANTDRQLSDTTISPHLNEQLPNRSLIILSGIFGGAITTSLVSTLQNLSINIPITLEGYVIPVIFGGAIGALIGLLWAKERHSKRALTEMNATNAENQQTQQALMDNERKLQAILDHHFQLTGLIDREGVLIEANQTSLQMAGVDKSAVLGQYFWDGPWWDDSQRSAIRDAFNRAVLGELIHFETTHCTATGEIRKIDFSFNPVRGNNDQVQWVVPEGRDITAFREAEKIQKHLARKIHVQAAQLEQILATMPEGVLLLDADRRVLNANPRAVSDLNVLADAGVGDILTVLGDQSIDDLLAPPSTRGLWHEVNQAGRIFEVIARPMNSSNTLIAALSNIAEAASMSNHWVMVINDVTKERDINYRIQQQERMAALGQLASGIAHDFNNIIAVIILYAQLGTHDLDATSKLQDRFNTIVQQAKQAADLIQQILDFSRSSVLEMHSLDLSPYLNEFVKLLTRVMPENIAISFERPHGEYLVHTDPTRLQQALMNLVVNARDAMPWEGHLTISLSRQSVVDNRKCVICGQNITGEWLQIQITDTGTGIPDDVLPHIFEPFFTTKEPGKGTGLGLPQVHGIVAQLNGHLSLKTQAGYGTSFTIYLPILAGQAQKHNAPAPDEFAYGSGETILLAEDNTLLQQALAENLNELGYCTLTATNGQHALDILLQRRKEIDLVLCDYVMPGMGGRMLLQNMQQHCQNTPVIILSGHPMESELKELQVQGLAGWMTKPPNMVKLSQMIAGVLAKQT